MTLKITLTTLILVVAPGLAAAQCAGKAHSQSAAISCADGFMVDEETGACIEITTG